MSIKLKFALLSVAFLLLIVALVIYFTSAIGNPVPVANLQPTALSTPGFEGGKPIQAPANRPTADSPSPVAPTATPVPPSPTSTPAPTATALPEPTPTLAPLPTLPPPPSPTPTPTSAPKVDFGQRFTFRKNDVVTYLKPGIIRVQRQMPGPIAINILLFDLTAPEFGLRVVLQNDWLSGVARTSVLGKANNAIAAVNGDLFSYNGLPQGMTMSDGKLALAPKRRATFAYSKDTGPFIGYFTQGFTWDSSIVSASGERHSLQVMNSICQEDWLCIYTDLYHQLPYGYDEVRVTLNAGNEVQAISQQQPLKIASGNQVLSGRGQAGKWLLANVKVGDKLQLNLVTDPDYHQFQQIVSGGPVFLRQGNFIQDCMCYLEDCSRSQQKGVLCEEFTTEWKLLHYLTVRMPRNAVGYNEDKSVLMVAVVDGYAPGHSIGMTQKELAQLFSEFGMESAMELDGGGSATMYVEGKLASRPSDGGGYVERAVPDAVVFNWNDGSTYDASYGKSTSPSTNKNR